jgi:TLD
LLSVDSWVNLAELDSANPIQDVVKRGFLIQDPSSGIQFTTGNIRFASDEPETHQFLLCTVAVGRSYVHDDPSAKRELPSGYDSLYLHDSQSRDASKDSADMGSSYRHNYVIFDPAQALPRYVVHFTRRKDTTAILQRRRLEGLDLASIKAKVSAALSVLGPAAGEATEKMLTDIEVAYESALAASEAPNPHVTSQRRHIRDNLSAIDAKLSAIQANSAAVEEALYARMQAALYQLQDETQKKMNLLLSEELELRRQLGQLDWTDSFVSMMRETLPPMSFISAWERHSTLQASLMGSVTGSGGRLGGVRVLDAVQADLQLVGKIEIVAGNSNGSSTNGNVPSPVVSQPIVPAKIISPVSSPTQVLEEADSRVEAQASSTTASLSYTSNAEPIVSSSISSTTTISAAHSTLNQPNIEALVARYSLRREADRRKRSLKGWSPNPNEAFAESRILSSSMDAQTLYMSLPFGIDASGQEIPLVTRLIWSSTEVDGPTTIASALSAYMSYGRQEPTVILIRANGHVFGGYAADPWDGTDLFGGSPRSFLFSIDKDCKVPFTGRIRGPRQPNDELLRQAAVVAQAQAEAHFNAALVAATANGQQAQYDELGRLLSTQYDEAGNPVIVAIPIPRQKPWVRHDAQRSNPDVLAFGVRDLMIVGDLSSCSSEIEHSYGIGLRPGSVESKTFFAGSATWAAEVVEMWSLSPQVMQHSQQQNKLPAHMRN